MATRITQVEDAERGTTILRVDGEMFYDDAVLLEKIAVEMREEIGRDITLDLADLDFLDSDGAPVLKRLERERGFEIVGLEYFLQKVINVTEKS